MTPDERAAKFEPRLSYSSSHRDRREMIAAAIRAAENDALERAAVMLEGLEVPDTLADVAVKKSAGLIRGLKHKE